MLVVDRQRGTITDSSFRTFPEHLRPEDALVLNNTRVFPARLQGRRNRADGAEVELFLLRALNEEESHWRVLAKPAKRVRAGDCILLSPVLQAQIVKEGERGEREVHLTLQDTSIRLQDCLERLGSVPLPPYIHRTAENADRQRYQTVFAEHRGSVAAPTAGLHFTHDMLERCRSAGAALTYVTLHVGLGTFAPLPEGPVDDLQLHGEEFDFPLETARVLRNAARRICIGTTSVRTLESALLRSSYEPVRGTTNLFIRPGFRFRGTDAILTNFHLPESSLLMLVCTFAGFDLMMAAYHHAVQQRYRFFSYGDCMLIV